MSPTWSRYVWKMEDQPNEILATFGRDLSALTRFRQFALIYFRMLYCLSQNEMAPHEKWADVIGT